jgi:hypothetical protein
MIPDSKEDVRAEAERNDEGFDEVTASTSNGITGSFIVLNPFSFRRHTEGKRRATVKRPRSKNQNAIAEDDEEEPYPTHQPGSYHYP